MFFAKSRGAPAIGDKDAELTNFFHAVERDRKLYITEPALLKWLFADRLYARNQLLEMNFYGFDGDAHLGKFFKWQQKSNIANYLPPDAMEPLTKTSLARDKECLARLNLAVADGITAGLARYNAQDYLLQRLYPVPDALAPRVILDFGAGYGRQANLAFGAQANVTRLLIAVDGIPGPYLTQRVYYRGLGLNYVDYIDFSDVREFSERTASHQVVHVPTWRLDLVSDGSVDLVCCVQVLKELPGEVLLFALRHFARVLKPRGALYIRDHEQFHHPNQMPIDELLLSMGFMLEFRPLLWDHVDIHGLPRIWRKLDSSLYLDAERLTMAGRTPRTQRLQAKGADAGRPRMQR